MEDFNTHYRAIKSLAIDNGYSQDDAHKIAESMLLAVMKGRNGDLPAYEQAYNDILKPLMA